MTSVLLLAPREPFGQSIQWLEEPGPLPRSTRVEVDADRGPGDIRLSRGSTAWRNEPAPLLLPFVTLKLNCASAADEKQNEDAGGDNQTHGVTPEASHTSKYPRRQSGREQAGS